MRRKITLKKGDTVEIHFEELDQFTPRYREMVLRLFVQEDKNIYVNTVFVRSSVSSLNDDWGVTLQPVFHS